MRKYSAIFILLILSVTACRQGSEKIERETLNNAIKEAGINSNHYRWMVVLPSLGCNGCIQEGEAFMKENITDTHILFILTNISSLKILQQKTNIRISEHSNIFVDRNNLFDIPTNNRIYPCVAELKDGKVFSHLFQRPQSAAFVHLEHQLKN